MRRLLITTMVLCLLAAPVYAATEAIGDGMVKKAVRGGTNLFTGIVEVPMQIYKGYNNGLDLIKNRPLSKGVGAVLGMFRGIGHAAGRMSWGALELVGFWTANHKDNEGVGIPLDAEYAWEMGEQYSIFKPTLGEGVKPIGRKIVRGLGDAFVGIAELPMQTIRGKDEGNALVGFGRGVWFWLSREVYGMGNLMTCIVPNPKDNPGYPFDREYPWSPVEKGAKGRYK